MLLAPRPPELREAAPKRNGCWRECGATVRTQPTNYAGVLYLRTKAARTAVALPGTVTSAPARRQRSRRWPVAAPRTSAYCAQMDRGLARRPGGLQNMLLAVRRISPVSATPACAGTRRQCAALGLGRRPFSTSSARSRRYPFGPPTRPSAIREAAVVCRPSGSQDARRTAHGQ